MRTLIIIDIQNDFVPGGALPVPEGDRIIPLINRFSHRFDLVVASQDWHPANHTSFASSHPGKQPFETMELHGRQETLWPDHCVQLTNGAQLHSDLDTSPVAAVFRKGMNPEIDSYSAFYDNGHLISTGLSGYLREKQATDLYFCGLAGDFCVYYSILDALAEGFRVFYIEDASRPIDAANHSTQKEELIAGGVKIVKVDDL